VVGEQIRLAALEGVIVSAAERTIEPEVAVIVAAPEALAPAVALKAPTETPDEIVIEAGTLTFGLLLFNDTITPA